MATLFTMNVFGQEITEKQKKFANSFIEAVGQNNSKKVIKMMDKAYRKEQLKNLNGNKEQFVNELFGGEDLKDNSVYVNMKLNEITRIEIAEVIPLKGSNEFNYIFRVRNDRFDILSTLLMKKKGRKYGFVGSFG